MDVSALSPEEKQALLEALQGGGSPQVEQVLGLIVEKLTALEERHTKLEAVVMDEIIGGITNLYKENSRLDGIKGLQGKYGDLFGESAGQFGELYGGDLYEKLFDHLEAMRGEEGFTDEAGDASVKEIAQQLAGRIGKVKGPKEAPQEVAAAVEAKAEPADPMAAVVDGVKKLKTRGRVPGIVGEPRD